MSLPLFAEPVRWVSVTSARYFAYQTGFRQGASGQSRSCRYDPDDEVDRYYQDGWRIGRLFRPLPCREGQT